MSKIRINKDVAAPPFVLSIAKLGGLFLRSLKVLQAEGEE
jgi:hypothetical protein